MLVGITGAVQVPSFQGSGGSISSTSLTLNEAADKVELVIDIPVTGTLTHVGFALGTVTTAQSLTVGLETVSTTDGNATGVAYGGSAAGTLDPTGLADTFQWVTLGTAASAAAGDKVAATIKFTSTAGNLNVKAAPTNCGVCTTRYVGLYNQTGAAWTMRVARGDELSFPFPFCGEDGPSPIRLPGWHASHAHVGFEESRGPRLNNSINIIKGQWSIDCNNIDSYLADDPVRAIVKVNFKPTIGRQACLAGKPFNFSIWYLFGCGTFWPTMFFNCDPSAVGNKHLGLAGQSICPHWESHLAKFNFMIFVARWPDEYDEQSDHQYTNHRSIFILFSHYRFSYLGIWIFLEKTHA